MLTVLNVAYPLAPVDDDPVGGAEQVLSALDRALVSLGHRSAVVAHASSRVHGQLIGIDVRAARLDGQTRARAIADTRRAIRERLAAGDVDLVHLHGIDCFEYLPDSPVPVLATLHLPLAWYPRAAFDPLRRVRRICVSSSQRATARALGLSPGDQDQLAVVNNGVALDVYRPTRRHEDFALAIGRICPEKGFDAAVRAARQAGVRLTIAGATFAYEAHERYFRDVLMPLLDGERRFVGPVGGTRKRRLLARARCVLIPSRVDETSSLVAMEALASGTPVIAFRRGALPDVVDHGRTGFIVDTEDEMAEAIAAAGELRRADCRAAAEARFSAGEMTRRYLALYAQVAARESSRRPSRPPARLEIEEVRDDARLAELGEGWAALCAGNPTATPFQRPEWVLAARRHLTSDAVLRSLAFHRSGRLVGLLPLEAAGDRLRWIGGGVSDYLDVICEPAAQAAVVESAVAWLERARPSWREIELDGLREGALLAGCPLPAGWHDARVARDPSPVLALPPAALHPKLAYYRRRLSRTGTVEWQTATVETVPDLLRALVALHAARWRLRGQPGVLADPAVQRFHHEAAVGIARAGLLRLYGLRLDGKIIAALYGFTQHGRLHYYLSGFDPAHARLCPGALMIDHAIQAAVAEGARELDFLRGREAYKYGWGAADRPALLRRIVHE